MNENSRIKPIEQATGITWAEWLKFMDGINAKNLNHHQIATKVVEKLMGKHDSPGWWGQSVTVAYEQYIGRRVPGQRPDGTFQASVSKATKLGMQELIDAWANFAAKDKAVLGLIKGDTKVSGTDKRISWRAKATDGSSVNVISEPKGNGSAAVVVQLLGLKTEELNNRAKAKWAAIVDRFLASL